MSNLIQCISPVNAYYLMVSLLAFTLMGIDKLKAVKNRRRIPEKMLMGLALMGGALGVITGMLVFRHKIRNPLFYLGAPVLYLIHRALVMPLLIRTLIEIGFAW
ncbi:MAG: DUF1294 domain-containing protein [Bacillota bacterium]|nr:DUF1294 domain-containing protein [Bacillota bacterium]MDW7676305.1 DUF1294 domain-containing protein [Bacillota bacterium]